MPVYLPNDVHIDRDVSWILTWLWEHNQLAPLHRGRPPAPQIVRRWEKDALQRKGESGKCVNDITMKIYFVTKQW